MGARYWSMLTAYFVTTVGDEFYLLALPLVLLGLGYPGSSATFLRCALMATTVASGFLIGSLADRYATGRLLTGSYAASGAVMLAAVGALVAGADGYLVSVLAACLLGVLVAVAAAGLDAGVPRTVAGPERIRHGYSLVESARLLASMLGPAAAGVVATGRSLVAIAGLNAATFAAAAGVTRLGGRGQRPPDAPAATTTGGGGDGDGGSDVSYWRQTVLGWRAVAEHPRLRIGVGLSLVTNVTLGADEVLFIVRGVRELGLSPATVALVVVGGGAVSILISVVLVRRLPRLSSPVAMTVAALVLGTAAVGIGLTRHAVLSAGLFCLLAAASTCYVIYWRSYRQEIVPSELLGRVSAVCRSIAYAGVVVGTGAVGLLQTAGVGTGPLFVVGGTLCVLGVLVVAAALRRADRPAAVR